MMVLVKACLTMSGLASYGVICLAVIGIFYLNFILMSPSLSEPSAFLETASDF